MTSVSELLGHLRRKVHRGRFTMGGGTVNADGTATVWGGDKIMEWANPDGPEAADLIEAQAATLREVREWILYELEAGTPNATAMLRKVNAAIAIEAPTGGETAKQGSMRSTTARAVRHRPPPVTHHKERKVNDQCK